MNIDLYEILKYLVTFAAGLASGVAITVKITSSNNQGNVTQNNNKVGGNMAGRDINK